MRVFFDLGVRFLGGWYCLRLPWSRSNSLLWRSSTSRVRTDRLGSSGATAACGSSGPDTYLGTKQVPIKLCVRTKLLDFFT